MSFIVPGQGKKNEEVIGTRAGAKPLTPESAPAAPIEEPPVVEFAGWPPALQKVVQDDFRRTSALAGYRWKTADAALVDVVRGLDDLLDLAADSIQDTEPQRSGRQTRKAPPPTAEVSFDEVADLLGIPADGLNEAIDDAGRPVRRSRADRRTALRAIKQLRVQLQQAEVTMDHARLAPLTGFIVRLALALGTAVGSQSPSELVAGDEHLDTLIPPAVGALAAFALERRTAALADAWNEHKPATLAAQTHKDLLESLSEAKPTNDTAATFGLLVRSARAWVACFQLDWPATDKVQYWQALDELPDAIRDDSLQTLHDRLDTLAPPR
ncbi:hypothetical protein [Kribbella sp. NBC_00359]|uniref:hypothetical protein n=1 Tax=Kribbella sp. NBC_00359 TaxID=2975966 RepID=UPI002E1C4B6C